MYSIVGGGIGGLTTALTFEKLGIPYQLYEKAPELKPVGAGILLTPNALKVFEWLGILNDLLQSGNSMQRITLTNPSLSPLFDYQQDDVKKKFGYHSISIHRWELQRILLENLPKEKIHLNKSFDRYTADKEELKIYFEDGSMVRTNFLIGADGIHSKIRKQLFPKSTIRYSGQTCWRGVCQLKDGFETYQHRGIEMWGEQLRFGISKIEKDKFYWFAVVLSPPDIKDIPGTTQRILLEQFKNFHQIVKELIIATSEDNMIRSDLYDVQPMTNWFQEQVCLLGDAAHATTPNMGQGGAQAIEDAYFLANAIKKNQPITAFQQFQKQRKKKVNTIVKQSWMMGKIGHWKYFTGLRNFVLRYTPWTLFKVSWRSIYRLE